MGQQNPDGTADDEPDEKAILGALASSEHRRKTATALQGEGMITPTEISEKSGLAATHTSRALRQLREKNIAELCVPEGQQKGRLHRLTDAGEEALQKLQ